MIPNVESIYQRIAESMTAGIAEPWESAEVQARFFPDSSTYTAEYVRQSDGMARSLAIENDCRRAVRELRQALRDAEQRVWGQMTFTLRPDGTFTTRWGYDDCDANGDLLYDEEAELRRYEERYERLAAAGPADAAEPTGRVVPRSVVWGRWMVLCAMLAMAIGQKIVSIFVPERTGAGLDAAALAVLVPCWSVGAAGIVLVLAGLLRYPGLDDKLDIGIEPGPSGRLFSSLTRFLACLLIVLFWLACLGFWTEPDEIIPLWQKVAISYTATAYCGFVLYLALLYKPATHRATTTYLNGMTIFFGPILIPLTWPMLFVLHGSAIRERVERNSRRSER